MLNRIEAYFASILYAVSTCGIVSTRWRWWGATRHLVQRVARTQRWRWWWVSVALQRNRIRRSGALECWIFIISHHDGFVVDETIVSELYPYSNDDNDDDDDERMGRIYAIMGQFLNAYMRIVETWFASIVAEGFPWNVSHSLDSSLTVVGSW